MWAPERRQFCPFYLYQVERPALHTLVMRILDMGHNPASLSFQSLKILSRQLYPHKVLSFPAPVMAEISISVPPIPQASSLIRKHQHHESKCKHPGFGGACSRCMSFDQYPGILRHMLPMVNWKTGSQKALWWDDLCFHA